MGLINRNILAGALLILWLTPLTAQGQQEFSSIRGFITEDESGEAVILANVFMLGTTIGQVDRKSVV